jgi:hypothetical protein
MDYRIHPKMHIKDPKLIPEHIKKMIDPGHRQELGIMTEEEREKKIDAYNERKLHADIRQLLNLKGIAFLECRMDKRSHATVGWPDFTMGLSVPCAWELKVDKARLRPEQEEMIRKMQTPPNSWHVKVIHSLEEAFKELRELGVT